MVDVQRVSTATVTKTGFSWAGFFKDAGLPASVCANYAVLFIDNRMKKSMLPDLNKEILHELGIRAIGDIISILRQAGATCTSSSSAPKVENRTLSKREQTTRDKESKSEEDTVSDQRKVVKRRPADAHQKTVSKRNTSDESETRKNEPSTKIDSKGDGRKRASDQSRKISLVNRPQRSKHDSPPEETRKSRKPRRISETHDSGCDSKSDSGNEEPVKAKKRMVVLEHKTIVKARPRRDSSPNSVSRERQQRTSKKETGKITASSRQVIHEKSPCRSSEDSGSDNENVSKLRRLNYLAQKWKSEVSDSESAGRDQVKYSESPENLGHQTVKFVFPDQQLVRLKFNEERQYDNRSDEIYRKRSNDKVIRTALIEGRRKLDRTRLDNGLGYLGSFKTDIEDEIKPGTLVSDQRDVKVLNRLGAKKEKSEEPEPSKGSLTILDNEGGRVTTSLSRQDRTVLNLTKSDNSVFKRLGPEQKVPTNPLSMGVLGSQSHKQTSHRSERERSPSPDREHESTLSQSHSSFTVRSRGKLPARTDLRDVIKCKGGFIPLAARERSPPSPPSRYHNNVTSSSSRNDDSSSALSAPDLRNKLSSNSGHVKKHVQDGRIVKLTTPKNQRSLTTTSLTNERSQESRESFINRVMKRVIDSRSSEQEWAF